MAFLLVSCGSSSSTPVGLQKSHSPATGMGSSVLKLYIRLPGLWESDHIRARAHCSEGHLMRNGCRLAVEPITLLSFYCIPQHESGEVQVLFSSIKY